MRQEHPDSLPDDLVSNEQVILQLLCIHPLWPKARVLTSDDSLKELIDKEKERRRRVLRGRKRKKERGKGLTNKKRSLERQNGRLPIMFIA